MQGPVVQRHDEHAAHKGQRLLWKLVPEGEQQCRSSFQQCLQHQYRDGAKHQLSTALCLLLLEANDAADSNSSCKGTTNTLSRSSTESLRQVFFASISL